MPSVEDELRSLIEEFRRRPHLLRDPRTARVLAQAIERLPDPAERKRLHRACGTGDISARDLGRMVGHALLDLLVLAAAMAIASWGMSSPWAARWGAPLPLVSGLLLSLVWLLLRSEALRVALVEAAFALARLSGHVALWFLEPFFGAARRAWYRRLRVRDIIATWRRLPASERQTHGAFLAFLERELNVALPDLASLSCPPDPTLLGEFLRRLENPSLRWRGDRRLLPSSLHWAVSRALDMAPPPGTPSGARTPSEAMSARPEDVVEHNRVPAIEVEELARLTGRIRQLEEEIRKVQSWNVTREAEELQRRQIIREKRVEMDALRQKLSSVAVTRGKT